MKINGEMLALAREYRGISQQELCDKVGVSQSQIAKIEGGLRPDIDDELLLKLSGELGFPADFFSQNEQVLGFGSSAFFYRKQAALTASERKKIHSLVNLLRIAIRQYIKHVDIVPSLQLPLFDIEDYGGSAAHVAMAARVMWNLPDGPVRNVTSIIEKAGVIIIPCNFDTRRFDATSLRLADMPPLIFINANLPGERWRYTLCHELGHLVMHTVPHERMEEEADQFAAEFLTPAQEIKPQLIGMKAWRLSELVRLKSYWKVSFGMLVMQGKMLGLLSKEQVADFYRRNPIRGVEPHPIEREAPTNLHKIASTICDRLQFGVQGMADLTKWPSELTQLVLPAANAESYRLRLVQ